MSRKRKNRRKKQKSRRTIGRRDPVVEGADLETINVRRWESAATHRLNACHWQNAHGNSINEDLAQDLETLRARSHWERYQNPMVEGVIVTHQTDVVGQEGPRLQIQSDDERFNEAVEEWWAIVYNEPDPTGRLSGPELLRLWIDSLWVNGEYLNEEVTYSREPGHPVTLGIHTFDARRLETPPEFANDPDVSFGIRLQTNMNTPTVYYKRTRESRGNLYDAPFRYEYDPLPADMVQHVYRMSEPDQLRGYPWLSPSLNVIADIRQADRYVMESVKNAAANSMYWWSNHPDAEFQDKDGVEQSIEPGTAKFIGGGWQPAMLTPTQPAAEYRAYRHERLRELGRPVCMPLMAVLLSSADSNFASAHYDGQVYMRALEWLQSLISRKSLDKYVKKVAMELELSRVVRTPRQWNIRWTWPKPPYVNPKQMYDALRAQLEDGTASYSDVLAFYGRDEETTIAARARTQALLEAANLPALPVNYGRGNAPQEEIPQPAQRRNYSADEYYDEMIG